MKRGYTSNVFYTFGFLLLYIHLVMNLVSVLSRKGFFQAAESLTLKPLIPNMQSIEISLNELLLVGGFAVLTIIGVILERIRLAFLSKAAEIGWSYRNRIKIYYSLIAIVLVAWTTIQGYVYDKSAEKQFDWVWVWGSLIVLVYCIFLISYPRFRKRESS